MIWKVVFWLYSLILAVVFAFALTTTAWKIVDWVSDLTLLVCLLLVYGLAYKKKWWDEQIRRLIATSAVGYSLVYFHYLDFKYGAYPAESQTEAIFVTIFLLPLFIGALLYAFRPIK